MTKLEFEKLQSYGFSPLPGRCVILLDPPPATIGHIIVPDSAKVHVVKASGYTGTVLTVTPDLKPSKKSVPFSIGMPHILNTPSDADFVVGDRVVLGLHADELTEEVVWARNGQVEAVITE